MTISPSSASFSFPLNLSAITRDSQEESAEWIFEEPQLREGADIPLLPLYSLTSPSGKDHTVTFDPQSQRISDITPRLLASFDSIASPRDQEDDNKDGRISLLQSIIHTARNSPTARDSKSVEGSWIQQVEIKGVTYDVKVTEDNEKLRCEFVILKPKYVNTERHTVAEDLEQYCIKKANEAEQSERKEKTYKVKLPSLTILFADVIGSTKLCVDKTDEGWYAIKETLFGLFEQLCKKYHCHTIKTIGDGYLVCSGLPFFDEQGDLVQDSPKIHAYNMIQLSIEMVNAAKKCTESYNCKTEESKRIDVSLRIGVNTGHALGCILNDLPLDIEGEEVNRAAQMEQSAEPNSIHITPSTFTLLDTDIANKFGPRGQSAAKEEDDDGTYFYTPKGPENTDQEEGHIAFSSTHACDLSTYDSSQDDIDPLSEKKLMLAEYCTREALRSSWKAFIVRLPSISILFADIVGSTQLSRRLGDEEWYRIKRNLFLDFGKWGERHAMQTIKTIGDVYMGCFGLPVLKEKEWTHVSPTKHAASAVKVAIQMIRAAKRHTDQANQTTSEKNPITISLRVGVHTGPALGCIWGKFPLDIEGNSVNKAARMKQASPPDSVLVTKETFECLSQSSHVQKKFTYIGTVQLKGYQTPDDAYRCSPLESHLTDSPEIPSSPDTIIATKIFSRRFRGHSGL